MDRSSLLDDLTPPQQQAVTHLEGPLLILAGPGSGKTRVVTRRIANLLEHGVSPRNVLAITFTNKAAGEMAARVQTLLPGTRMWISTFHRFCARLLREYGELVGLKSNFSILDTGDQKQAVRRVMQDLDFDPLHFSPDKVLWRISNAKNDLITPERYAERFEEMVADHWQAVVRRVYPEYQKWLLESNSVDFDDLLLHTAIMLSENSELREQLDERYRYILVDEYQDTNMAQYQIVAALSQIYPNLCVTGDPDQSIYGWRGARIENILRFERDYPQAQVVRLEQNFRSTQSILESADALIVNNKRRKHKGLFTDLGAGDPVQLLRFDDSAAEAEGIARLISDQVAEEGRSWNDFAVFYRVNSLSRTLETAFSRMRVPYQVAAGVAFYERAEIRDLLAYLRLIENPEDQAAFLRIINKPLRGLGKTSQSRLAVWAGRSGLTLLDAAAQADQVPKLSKRAIAAFRQFANMMNEFSLANSGGVAELLEQVIERTRYTAPWIGVESEDALGHLSNVEELVDAARQYDSAAGDERSLQGFLEQTALISDTDKIENESGRVTLMTLHAAKGLEFPVVFIVGVEEGLIPHERSTRENDPKQIEEERRLLFVGITRAQQSLMLTESRIRSMHGKLMPTIPSCFLSELICEIQDCGIGGGEVPLWAVPVREHDAFNEGDDASVKDADNVPQTSEPPRQKPLLTTAAALLNGNQERVPLPIAFQPGQQVRHPRYGRGTVTATGGYGGRRTVTVEFAEDARTETFIAGKAPLQPIGT